MSVRCLVPGVCSAFSGLVVYVAPARLACCYLVDCF